MLIYSVSPATIASVSMGTILMSSMLYVVLVTILAKFVAEVQIQIARSVEQHIKDTWFQVNASVMMDIMTMGPIPCANNVKVSVLNAQQLETTIVKHVHLHISIQLVPQLAILHVDPTHGQILLIGYVDLVHPIVQLVQVLIIVLLAMHHITF